MALHKRSSTPAKLPFPGESPTVSLARAAGQMYGLNEVEETPAKSSRSKAGKGKAAAKPARKASATSKATATAKPKSKSKTKSK